MSHFVCGKVIFAESTGRDERKDASLNIFRQAFEKGFFLMLAPNISQSIVYEILGSTPRNFPPGEPGELPFLLTDSPLSDTSEELLVASPTSWSLDAECLAFEVGVRRIQDMMSTIINTEGVKAIHLYFSDGGLDDHYKEIAIKVSDLAKNILPNSRTADDLPSLKFVLSH